MGGDGVMPLGSGIGSGVGVGMMMAGGSVFGGPQEAKRRSRELRRRRSRSNVMVDLASDLASGLKRSSSSNLFANVGEQSQRKSESERESPSPQARRSRLGGRIAEIAPSSRRGSLSRCDREKMMGALGGSGSIIEQFSHNNRQSSGDLLTTRKNSGDIEANAASPSTIKPRSEAKTNSNGLLIPNKRPVGPGLGHTPVLHDRQLAVDTTNADEGIYVNLLTRKDMYLDN